jgi:hypothetical protein
MHRCRSATGLADLTTLELTTIYELRYTDVGLDHTWCRMHLYVMERVDQSVEALLCIISVLIGG